MAERSSIEWTDATFNPWIGCTKVSPGCDNCYAEQQDKFRKWTPMGWGAGNPRRRTSESLWAQPVKWSKAQFLECDRCHLRGEVPVFLGYAPSWAFTAYSLKCLAPGCKGFARPVRRRVFCASLADVFDNEVDPRWRADLFSLIARTPQLDWQLLTKRIGNAHRLVLETRDLVPRKEQADFWEWLDAWVHGAPPANVWLGATVVNQEEADRDIPKLLTTPAHVRFLSMEPLLGPVDLSHFLRDNNWRGDGSVTYRGIVPGTRVDWVIVGGESGPGARPLHSEIVRMLRDQCAAAGVPFLFKQWGEFQPGDADCDDPAWPDVPESRLYWIDGTKWDRFDGQRAGVSICARVGKKAAGRLLDGRTHDGFPEVACAT